MRTKSAEKFKFNTELFADRVKKLRLKHNLKQQDIARFMNKTRGAYGGVENGNFSPGIEMLIAIRVLYNERYHERLTMDFLFGYEDDVEKVEQPETKIDYQKIINEKDMLLKEKIEIIEMQKELLRFYKAQAVSNNK